MRIRLVFITSMVSLIVSTGINMDQPLSSTPPVFDYQVKIDAVEIKQSSLEHAP